MVEGERRRCSSRGPASASHTRLSSGKTKGTAHKNIVVRICSPERTTSRVERHPPLNQLRCFWRLPTIRERPAQPIGQFFWLVPMIGAGDRNAGISQRSEEQRTSRPRHRSVEDDPQQHRDSRLFSVACQRMPTFCYRPRGGYFLATNNMRPTCRSG